VPLPGPPGALTATLGAAEFKETPNFPAFDPRWLVLYDAEQYARPAQRVATAAVETGDRASRAFS